MLRHSRWKIQGRRQIKYKLNTENTQIKYYSKKQTANKPNPRSVAFYDTRPGNEVSLFYKAAPH